MNLSYAQKYLSESVENPDDIDQQKLEQFRDWFSERMEMEPDLVAAATRYRNMLSSLLLPQLLLITVGLLSPSGVKYYLLSIAFLTIYLPYIAWLGIRRKYVPKSESYYPDIPKAWPLKDKVVIILQDCFRSWFRLMLTVGILIWAWADMSNPELDRPLLYYVSVIMFAIYIYVRKFFEEDAGNTSSRGGGKRLMNELSAKAKELAKRMKEAMPKIELPQGIPQPAFERNCR